MKYRVKTWLAGAGLLALTASAALAAGFFTNGVPTAGGSQYPSTLPLTGNETIPADTNLPSGLNPASEAITVSALQAALQASGTPRNYLDNGGMFIDQQGTGIITGGQTSITALEFAGDRWFVDANVSSGASRGQITTSAPVPPAGFVNSMVVYRTSGALTQPVCTLQEIATGRATQLQGKTVVFSSYLQALAGLSSTAKQVSLYVITGTGSDQGLGTLTASPAITPAWTGIATAGSVTVPTTTSWARYNTSSVVIPTTATEVGVEICFTPGATGSGTTDGFAFTGAQLEVVGSSGVVAPSTYNFLPAKDELLEAQTFFWQLNEPASGAGAPGFCQATSANTNTCSLDLPVVMRGTTPTIAIGTAGTFKVNIAGTATTFATPTAGVCSKYECTVTGANTNTNGQAEQLTGGGGTGVWTVSNDVIM